MVHIYAVYGPMFKLGDISCGYKNGVNEDWTFYGPDKTLFGMVYVLQSYLG